MTTSSTAASPTSSIQKAIAVLGTGKMGGILIEAFLKRGIVGTYHKMSETYMPLYVNEFEFRHNNRGNPDAFDLIIARC